MRFQGAVVREQGVTFAIAIVKRHVLDCRTTAGSAINVFAGVFPGLPIVLMAQDSRGRPTYFGRADITRFLARVPLTAIPWHEYTLT